MKIRNKNIILNVPIVDGDLLNSVTGGGGGAYGVYYNETIAHPATLSTAATSTFNSSIVTRNMPFILQADTNLTKVHIRVNTASSGNGVFGLYKWDGNTGQTFEKVYEESTLFDLTVTGAQTITLSTPQVLTAGEIYIPILLIQSNTFLYTISNSGLGSQGILGRSSDFVNYSNVLESYTSYSVPMPSSISFSVVNSQFACNTLLTLENA